MDLKGEAFRLSMSTRNREPLLEASSFGGKDGMEVEPSVSKVEAQPVRLQPFPTQCEQHCYCVHGVLECGQDEAMIPRGNELSATYKPREQTQATHLKAVSLKPGHIQTVRTSWQKPYSNGSNDLGPQLIVISLSTCQASRFASIHPVRS